MFCNKCGKTLEDTDQHIPCQVNGEVPGQVCDIITEGMRQLFIDIYAGSVSVEDSLSMIETQANEKWSTIG